MFNNLLKQTRKYLNQVIQLSYYPTFDNIY